MKQYIVLIILGTILLLASACSIKDINPNGSNDIKETSAIDTTEQLSTTEQKSEIIDIGIVLPTKNEPRWIQEKEQFMNEIINAGYTVEVMYSDNRIDKEMENVKYLVDKGIKVLIIAPCDSERSGAAAEQAKTLGVTVISHDRLLKNTSAVDYYISIDPMEIGEMQGNYLVEMAGDELVPGAKLPLFLYTGHPIDSVSYSFFEAAHKVLQPYIMSGAFLVYNYEGDTDLSHDTLTQQELISVVSDRATNWTSNDARSLAETDLANYTGMGDVYILSPNDLTARSISDEFNNSPRVDSYIITGQDAERASVQYIIDGKQSMTIFKDVRKIVTTSVEVATKILKGETIHTNHTVNNNAKEIPTIYIELKLVQEDNVRQLLIDTGYYNESDFNWQ